MRFGNFEIFPGVLGAHMSFSEEGMAPPLRAHAAIHTHVFKLVDKRNFFPAQCTDVFLLPWCLELGQLYFGHVCVAT